MTHLDRISDLIRRLLESFLDHSRDLHVEINGEGQVIEWVIEVHQDDQRKAVGAQGCHIKALKFIVAEIGLTAGADYRVLLRDRPKPEFPERSAPKLAKSYNETAATQLLHEVIKEITGSDLRIEAIVTNATATPRNPLACTFIIYAGVMSRKKLAKQDDAGDQTLLGAIGTIFRAYANREGVAFKLEVAP